jgi:hypothetical protein
MSWLDMNVLPSAEAGAVGPGSATLLYKPEAGPVGNGVGGQHVIGTLVRQPLVSLMQLVVHER